MTQKHSLRWITLRRVLPIMLLVLMAIVVLTQWNIRRTIRREVDARMQITTATTATQLGHRFNLLRSSATTLAENDLIINSIVDKQQRKQQLTVFFRSLRLPGLAFRQVTMFDYRGRPIVSSQANPLAGKTDLIDVTMAGKEYFDLTADRITIGAPVRYNESPEATIAIEYDTRAFMEDYRSPDAARRLRLLMGENVVYDSDSDGVTANEPDSERWVMANADVVGYPGLSFQQSKSIEAELSTLGMVNRFFLLASIAFVLALSFGIFSAARFATEPLDRLAQQIADIQDRNDLSHRLDEGNSLEMERLTDAFNTTLGSLYKTTATRDELASSDHRLRTVLQTVPTGIVATDTSGKITLANASLESMLGVGDNDLIGKSIGDLIPDLKIAAGTSPADSEARQLIAHHASGESFPVEIKLSPVLLLEGEGVLASVVDLRRRVANAKERERLLHETQLLFNSIPALVIFKDTKNNLLRVNRAAAEVIGASPSEIEGRPSSDFFEQHEQYHEDDLVVIQSREPRLGIVEPVTTSDGKTRWVTTNKIPIFDASDEVTGVLAVIFDITELKDTQAAFEQANLNLQRSNEELAQFAYVASHDLQEPLRKVTAFCDLLVEDYGDALSGDGRSYLDYIVDGAQRMRKLIQDLLTFSSVESKGRPRQEVDLAVVVKDVLLIASPLIKETQAVVTSGDLPVISADRMQLMQLMQNLIGNAIKYRSDRQPEIHVAAETTDQGWIISVTDNGIGIDAKHHDQIFGVFKRLHTMDAYPGTGIGLAICKRIVQRLGGEITVASEPGKGSTFYVNIPRTGGNA